MFLNCEILWHKLTENETQGWYIYPLLWILGTMYFYVADTHEHILNGEK